MVEINTDTPSETEAGTKAKLDAGRQNPVKTTFTFHANDAVPFDADALYSYLLAQAEQHYHCSSPDDVVAMFEAEFASSGVVPELIATTVADRLTENGIAGAPHSDDLHHDALVVLFVDEYTSAFAAEPSTLPDPRGDPCSVSLMTFNTLKNKCMGWPAPDAPQFGSWEKRDKPVSLARRCELRR